MSHHPISIAQLKQIMSCPDKIAIPGHEAVGANLLDNSGFESDINGNGIPDGWQTNGNYLPEEYRVDPSGISIDTTKAHSGKRCVKLTKIPMHNTIVSLRQRFRVEAGRRYRGHAHYQTDVTTGHIVIIFTAFDNAGNWLRHQGSIGGARHTGDT